MRLLALSLLMYLFIGGSESLSQTLINLNDPLNDTTYKKWDAYIKKFAPSDSAFNVVVRIANINYYSKRYAASKYAFELYKPLFKHKEKFLDEQIKLYGQIMLTQKASPDLAFIYVKFIKEKAPADEAFIAVQRIAEYYIEKKDWDSAAYIYEIFKPYFKDKQEDFDDIIAIIKAGEEGLVVRNLGNLINTFKSEWDPNPTPGGEYLYFTSNHRAGGQGSDDVWVSELKSGVWQKPVNLGQPVNGINQETIDNVFVDGNGLMLSGTFEGSFGGFDIYMTRASESGWGDLEHLPIPINTKYLDESGYLTGDGNAIIFCSDRPGGTGEFHQFNQYFHGDRHGNIDIYIAIKNESGWGEPINLGPVINTPFAERAAYLHPDGKTLYFSSDGHPGLGRMDVFKSTRLDDDSWTEWSKPVNLGKEINSAKNDWGYVVSLKGDSAFFASRDRPDNYGEWDIYSIALPKSAKPEQVVTISGKVIRDRRRPTMAKIIWEDLETGEIVGELRSNPRTGHYFIVLPLGKNYGYYAEKKGHYPTSSSIDLTNATAGEEIKENIFLTSAGEMKKNNASIIINNIFFDFDKSELKQESFPELDRLDKFLTNNRREKIIIEGHTDDVGSNKYNLELSLKRAEAVRDYLIDKGHPEKRFSVNGFGNARPITKGKSDRDRQKNRRVEIRFR